MSITIALSLAGTVAASPPIADIPQPAQFGDWIVACNNIRQCSAIAALEYGTDLDWSLTVTRGAGADAAPIVSVSPTYAVYNQPTQIRIDGRMTKFALGEAGYVQGDTLAFLKAIARGAQAEVIAADGKVVGRLPVKGASAGLRWVDDQQKRVGTVTAVVAHGKKTANAVPTPPSAPRITQPDPSDSPAQVLKPDDIAAIQKAGDCSRPVGKEEFFRLDSEHTLGLIPCVLGAYQGFSMVVIIDEAGEWSLAPLEQPRELDITYRPIEPWMYSGVTSADFAQETRMLYEFAKGRGMADCGQSAAWAWDGEVFRLASFNEMRECRGTPPGDWPSLWVTQNAQVNATQ